MSPTDPRATTELRIPAAQLKPGDLVNTSPGADDDWQQVLGVYPSPTTISTASEEVARSSSHCTAATSSSN